MIKKESKRERGRERHGKAKKGGRGRRERATERERRRREEVEKGDPLAKMQGRARERDPWIRMHKVLAEDTSVFPRNYVVRFTAHCNFIPREDIASVCWTLGTLAFTCIYPHKDIRKEINNYK